MATRSPNQASRAATGTTIRDATPVTISRWRIYVLLAVALLIIARVVVRLGEVQIVDREKLATLASNEINRQITLRPERGVITDRMGNVLAIDVERESLWVVPSFIPEEKVSRLALTLAPLVNKTPQALETAMTSEDYYWLPVARWLEPEIAEQIERLEEPGLSLQYEPRRVYPQGEFAAQIIGSVNDNGDGNSGIENYYNSQLKGITGTLRAEFDGAHNPISIAPKETRPARHGKDLVLTLDPFIQDLVESKLYQAVESHNADGGSIIVMDVRTGAIRGMANWPPFDPNNYGNYPIEVFMRNPAISDLYEPGSTFKIFTVAAGLQANAFTADTRVNDSGVIQRYGESLKNWNGGANGMITPGEVLYHSSNVGALLLNELTGPDQFYQTVLDLGFSAPTGVDMGGEEVGIVHDVFGGTYNDMTLLTNSYGQGISVTPLQMVRAVSAIANDGLLPTPHVVAEVCDDDGTCTASAASSQPPAQVLSPDVAWTVRRMLVNSANHYAPVVWAGRNGSFADQWLVPGYQVCAKTGTSSIPLPGGGYDPSFTIGSVLGFAPAEQARYAVLVKVDRPKDDIWGVRTAVPVFYEVVDQLMRYERIAPDPGLVSPGQKLGSYD